MRKSLDGRRSDLIRQASLSVLLRLFTGDQILATAIQLKKITMHGRAVPAADERSTGAAAATAARAGFS